MSNDGATVVASSVHDSDLGGIYVAAGSPLMIGNTIYQIGSGFYGNLKGIETSGPHPTVKDNIVYASRTYGIFVDNGAHGLISGNEVYGNYYGIQAADHDVNAAGDNRLVVIGNRVHDNQAFGIMAFGGAIW